MVYHRQRMYIFSMYIPPLLSNTHTHSRYSDITYPIYVVDSELIYNENDINSKPEIHFYTINIRFDNLLFCH